MERRVLAFVAAALSVTGPALAAPFAFTTNVWDQTMSVIDLGPSPPVVHGPFFTGGELTDGLPDNDEIHRLIDLAPTPDERFLLVSHVDDHLLLRLDITDPTAPVLAGSLDLGTIAQDIAMAPNGEFAVVRGNTTNDLVFVRIDPFEVIGNYDITSFSESGATAVALAADSTTLLAANFDSGEVVYGAVDATAGVLLSETVISIADSPASISIGRDGTVLIPHDDPAGGITVMRVTGPGTVVPGTPPTLGGLPGNQATAVFSPDGTRAYVLSTVVPNVVSILSIAAPGAVAVLDAGAVTLPGTEDGQWFAQDILDITRLGDRLVAGNGSGVRPGPAFAAVVDLSTLSATTVPIAVDYPGGVAIVGQVSVLEIPALGPWGIGALVLALGALGGSRLRPRRRSR